MDRGKTGALIAAARKEKDLTQRELAQTLHISDRAVSKWERGAGFPDVGLLEPLAAALDAFQERRRQTRRYVLGELGKVGLFLLVAGMLLAYMFPLKRDVDQTVTAGVYLDGVLIDYTAVEMQGEIAYQLNGDREYWGRFAIGCVEWTSREQANAEINLRGEDGLSYTMSGITSSELWDMDTIISPDMREFAFALQSPYILHGGEPRAETWCILATSPEMYEAYCAQKAYAPPALTAPHPEQLPEFPSAWKR